MVRKTIRPKKIAGKHDSLFTRVVEQPDESLSLEELLDAFFADFESTQERLGKVIEGIEAEAKMVLVNAGLPPTLDIWGHPDGSWSEARPGLLEPEISAVLQGKEKANGKTANFHGTITEAVKGMPLEPEEFAAQILVECAILKAQIERKLDPHQIALSSMKAMDLYWRCKIRLHLEHDVVIGRKVTQRRGERGPKFDVVLVQARLDQLHIDNPQWTWETIRRECIAQYPDSPSDGSILRYCLNPKKTNSSQGGQREENM